MAFFGGKLPELLLLLIVIAFVQHFQGVEVSAFQIMVCRPCPKGTERPVSSDRWNLELDQFGCPVCNCPLRDCLRECGGPWMNAENNDGCAICRCTGRGRRRRRLRN